jgi:23S rRNA pseudouridine2457 synthase
MVHGIINANAIGELSHGVEITVNGQSYLTKPCDVKILERTDHIIERFVRDPKHGKTSWLSITIREGKFRQVRKMTAKVGYPTLRLVRVRIGEYRLGKMNPGEIEVINY